MYHSLEQVRDSGLIPEPRMTELLAEVECRLEGAFTGYGHRIANATVAAFPDGRRMLYTLHDHDPQQQYCRRDLLAALMTDAEIELINQCYSSAASRRREADRFARATKVPASQWKGGVFWGDMWKATVEEMIEVIPDYSEDPEEVTYLWASKPQEVIPSFDVEDVVSHWLDDRGWEDMDLFDLEGVPELQAAIDAFVKANEAVVSHSIDYSTAILIDPIAADRELAAAYLRGDLDHSLVEAPKGEEPAS